MALIKQLLHEILSKYALRKCVYRPIVHLRLDSIIPFFLVFLSTSALPANSSLELNIQLVPHMSQDPTQLNIRPPNTSVRMHISIYIFLRFHKSARFTRPSLVLLVLSLIMHVVWTPCTVEVLLLFVFIFSSVLSILISSFFCVAFVSG